MSKFSIADQVFGDPIEAWYDSFPFPLFSKQNSLRQSNFSIVNFFIFNIHRYQNIYHNSYILSGFVLPLSQKVGEVENLC